MAEMFALRDSTLDAFLYAKIGTEANGCGLRAAGCGLKILSLLARLGKDPQAEAALWSRKSKDGAVDALTQSINLVQLRQPPAEPARSTALRLVDLLPRAARSRDAKAGADLKAAASIMPNGIGMMALVRTEFRAESRDLAAAFVYAANTALQIYRLENRRRDNLAKHHRRRPIELHSLVMHD